MRKLNLYDQRSIQNTAQKIKFFTKDYFSKCDQIRSFLRIWSHLLKWNPVKHNPLTLVVHEKVMYLNKPAVESYRFVWKHVFSVGKQKIE